MYLLLYLFYLFYLQVTELVGVLFLSIKISRHKLIQVKPNMFGKREDLNYYDNLHDLLGYFYPITKFWLYWFQRILWLV